MNVPENRGCVPSQDQSNAKVKKKIYIHIYMYINIINSFSMLFRYGKFNGRWNTGFLFQLFLLRYCFFKVYSSSVSLWYERVHGASAQIYSLGDSPFMAGTWRRFNLPLNSREYIFFASILSFKYCLDWELKNLPDAAKWNGKREI